MRLFVGLFEENKKPKNAFSYFQEFFGSPHEIDIFQLIVENNMLKDLTKDMEKEMEELKIEVNIYIYIYL